MTGVGQPRSELQIAWCGEHRCHPDECFEKHRAFKAWQALFCTKCTHPKSEHTDAGLCQHGYNPIADSTRLACKCYNSSIKAERAKSGS